MIKKEATKLATDYGWTAKDAERAYKGLDVKEASREELLIALIKFAGPTLSLRQRQQAAQRGRATKASRKLESVEVKLAKEIRDGEQKLQELRSTFIPVIFRVYSFAKKFGMSDPWIEALLEAHKAYFEEDSDESAA